MVEDRPHDGVGIAQRRIGRVDDLEHEAGQAGRGPDDEEVLGLGSEPALGDGGGLLALETLDQFEHSRVVTELTGTTATGP